MLLLHIPLRTCLSCSHLLFFYSVLSHSHSKAGFPGQLNSTLELLSLLILSIEYRFVPLEANRWRKVISLAACYFHIQTNLSTNLKLCGYGNFVAAKETSLNDIVCVVFLPMTQHRFGHPIQWHTFGSLDWNKGRNKIEKEWNKDGME